MINLNGGHAPVGECFVARCAGGGGGQVRRTAEGNCASRQAQFGAAAVAIGAGGGNLCVIDLGR